MDLLEWQGKQLFADFGIPVPRGKLVRRPGDADRPGVLKAQVPTGYRGKHGGIVFAKTAAAARKAAARMLKKSILGFPVREALLSDFVDIRQEMYFSLSVDRAARGVACLFSEKGGADVESLARPLAFNAADGFARLPADVRPVAQKALRLMRENDCLLVEINPLARTAEGLVAVDAKVSIDDNALFRHVGLGARAEANYVELSGSVGVIGNGAGLVMATLDAVQAAGARPASFFDVGGGTGADAMQAAVSRVQSLPSVRVILVNIYAGITHCDEVAQGIIAARPSVPIVVRMTGTAEDEGRAILEKAGIHAVTSMREAVRKAAALSKRRAI
jgi:succinyl-CoA synthetase beta subunit